jgi:hypothetical protein
VNNTYLPVGLARPSAGLFSSGGHFSDCSMGSVETIWNKLIVSFRETYCFDDLANICRN